MVPARLNASSLRLQMLEPIFNLNDVLLIITIAVSLLLVLVQPIFPAKKRDNRILLACFFLSLAISNTGVMLIWNEYIDNPAWLNGLIPYFYTASVLLKGPALYLYVASITHENFRWTNSHLWHLLAIFGVWPLLVICNVDTAAMRLENLDNLPITDAVVHLLWYLLKIIPLCYFIAATLRVRRYHQRMENQFSHVNDSSIT